MKLEKVSYHTHTTISDGKLSPEELIKLAIEKGFKVLAITDHYTRTGGISSSGWGMDFYSDDDYENLVRLKEKYSDKIKILVGAEFDWLPTKKEWLSEEVKKRDYDIKILSFHQIYINGKYYNFNASEDRFENVLNLFDNSMHKLVRYYYENLRDGIKTGWFDVVGHLDLVKIFNKDSKYFSEDENWYKKEVLDTLELMKKFNMKLDVNLQGFIFAIGEQFPSKWIISEAKKMGIELLVGTDSHSPDTLDYDLGKVEELMDGK